ncbi:ArsR/SmtB family transcription factor [Propionibacteriaceae bacterium Y1923]
MESPNMEQLRAVAHPTRIRIMTLLAYQGPLRATDLGEPLGLAPNAVSYHLRILARAGLVTEATGVGQDKRERWWQTAHARYEIDDPGQAPQLFTHIRQVVERALGQAVQSDLPEGSKPALSFASAWLPPAEFDQVLGAVGAATEKQLKLAQAAAEQRGADKSEWRMYDIVLVASPAPREDGSTS